MMIIVINEYHLLKSYHNIYGTKNNSAYVLLTMNKIDIM